MIEVRRNNKISERGFTLLELIITITILGILAAGAIPITRNAIKHQREVDLHQALRDLRDGIDRYKKFTETNPGAVPIEKRTDSGYPKDLQTLVDGFNPAGVVGDHKIKFLRRIPIDPMTGKAEWDTHSYQDNSGTTSAISDDVFDVSTKSDGTALNGTKYKDW